MLKLLVVNFENPFTLCYLLSEQMEELVLLGKHNLQSTCPLPPSICLAIIIIFYLAWENSRENLKLEYLPAPEVDGAMIKSLERWSKGPGPTVLVIGAGTESIRSGLNVLWE